MADIQSDKRFRARTKRSSTLYWRTDRNSGDAKNKHGNTQVQVHSKTASHPQRITLKQLCSEDKHRVRQLIQELASTGEEREKLEQRLREERGEFQELLARATQQCQELVRERNQLETELADSQLQLQAVQSQPHTHSHPHTHAHSHPQTQTCSHSGHVEEQCLEKPLLDGSGNILPAVEHNSRISHSTFLGPSTHVPVNFDLDAQAGGPRLAAVGLDTHPPMMSAIHSSVKSTVGITSTTHPPMMPLAVPMTATAQPPMMSSAVPMTSTAHPPMMSSAVPMTSTAHPPMELPAVLMTSAAHPPMTSSAVPMKSTTRPPLSVTSALLRPLPSATRIPSSAGDSIPLSASAHPLVSTDIKGGVQPPPPKVVNVESVLTYPVQNPHSCLHSDPAQPAYSSLVHVPSLTRNCEVPHSSHYERCEHNLVSTASEVAAARGMEQGVHASGGLQPPFSYQMPVSSVAVPYPPRHSSLNDFNVPGGHSTTSYPLHTGAPPSFLRPVPASDAHTCFPTSRLPAFCQLPQQIMPSPCQRPQQSMPTSMGHVVACAEADAANNETYPQQQPQESDPQSPSLGEREFVEHYRPESRTPPIDEWTCLPLATPQLVEDGGTQHTCTYATRGRESHHITSAKTPSPARGRPRALQSDSADDEPALESRCKTLHPHMVSHRNAVTQTASAELDSVQPLNQPSAAPLASPLLSARGTNTDPNNNETKDRGVQTTETDHFDSRQLIADSGKENSFLSHSSLKQTTVQAVLSKSETEDGRSQKATTSASSSADLKPIGHSRMLKARAADGHPRALSPILPSKLVPTPSLSSGLQAESASVDEETHLEALMATALLNAQDTVDTIRSLARLNRSRVPSRASSTVLASPSPEHGGDSRGDFPDVMALSSGLERSLSPLLAPRASIQGNLTSQTLFPQRVSGRHGDYPAGTASALVRNTSSTENTRDVAAAKGTVLSPRTAHKSGTRAALQGRVRRRLLEESGTGRDCPESGFDDGDRDIIEELFFIT